MSVSRLKIIITMMESKKFRGTSAQMSIIGLASVIAKEY